MVGRRRRVRRMRGPGRWGWRMRRARRTLLRAARRGVVEVVKQRRRQPEVHDGLRWAEHCKGQQRTPIDGCNALLLLLLLLLLHRR